MTRAEIFRSSLSFSGNRDTACKSLSLRAPHGCAEALCEAISIRIFQLPFTSGSHSSRNSPIKHLPLSQNDAPASECHRLSCGLSSQCNGTPMNANGNLFATGSTT
mmetsp:Transcript_4531/g.17138  ORF Transcript_4531/g.17138 Transcript_4531/m.17138 type:complete len:106 (-) Transcript_4531:501-818(-)